MHGCPLLCCHEEKGRSVIDQLFMPINCFGVPLFLGYLLLSRLGVFHRFPLFVALSFALTLGFGIVTHWMLVLIFFAVPLDVASIVFPLLGMGAMTVIFFPQKPCGDQKPAAAEFSQRWGLIEKALVLYIFFQIA